MKKLALAAVLAAVAVAGWRYHRHDAPDAALLFHRAWLDHIPRDQKEKFQVLFVNADHPFGHFAARTVWTGQLEFFHYHVIPKEPGTIDFLFGATQEIQRVRYTARRCDENGFDFCLELGGTSRGVARYYSKREWTVEDRALDELRAATTNRSGAR